MNTPLRPMESIRDKLGNAALRPPQFLWGPSASVRLADLRCGTSLGGRLRELTGRSVLIATRDQLAAALALIELDGIARRLVVVTPDLAAEHLPAIAAKAAIDAIVSDREWG